VRAVAITAAAGHTARSAIASHSHPASPVQYCRRQLDAPGVVAEVRVRLGLAKRAIARLGGPKVLPLTLGCIHGLGSEPVQLAKKIGQDPVPVGDDHVVVIGHHARRVNHNTRTLRGERQAVEEDPVGSGAGSKAKRALVAAPSDQIRLASNDASRIGHGMRNCEGRTTRERPLSRGILSCLRGTASSPGWRGHPCATAVFALVPSCSAGWLAT
jgi:hypothetical protein